MAASGPDRAGAASQRQTGGTRRPSGDNGSRRLMEAASIAHAHAEHHGPPPAHRSSRAEPATLGMLLFIISEVMIFGAFFTAYFFIRVVNHDPWPAHGTLLPEAVAGINTAILLSSSLTLHWALVSTRNGNRWAMKVGMLTTFLLGLAFLTIQINEYIHIGFAPHDSAEGTVFYSLTGLHGAHVFIGLCLLAFEIGRASCRK